MMVVILMLNQLSRKTYLNLHSAMCTQIKTSKRNREVVTELSRKFNLGAENMIARIALVYSLSLGRHLSISDIEDSQGK